MRARHFKAEEHAMVSEWWKAHGFTVIPLSRLPKLGWIVENENGIPMCAAWLYKDGGLAQLEWIVGNPAARLMARRDAIECLVEQAEREAKLHGVQVIISSLKRNSLVRLFKRKGFLLGDQGLIQVVKEI